MSFGFGDLLKFFDEQFGRFWANFLAIFIAIGVVVLVLTQVITFLGTVSTWLDGIGIKPSFLEKAWFVGKFIVAVLLLLMVLNSVTHVLLAGRLHREARVALKSSKELLYNIEGRTEAVRAQLDENVRLAKTATEEAKEATESALRAKAEYENKSALLSPPQASDPTA